MRPRVGAAALAVLGASLVVVAVFTPSWWSGPISIAGRVIHNKTVHISMLRASGCNAGDGSCMGLDVDAGFRALGLLTLILATSTAAAAVAMAHRWWRYSPAAPSLARLALLGTALTVMGASFFIGTLPERFAEIAAGFSPFAFFAGTAATAVASLLVLRKPVARRVAEEPVDVRELLSTDMLRPAVLGPEPKMGRQGRMSHEEQSFSSPSAPRFRPLYEVQAPGPQPHGMAPTGGFAPVSAGPMPIATPYPQAAGTYPPAPSGRSPQASPQYAQVEPSASAWLPGERERSFPDAFDDGPSHSQRALPRADAERAAVAVSSLLDDEDDDASSSSFLSDVISTANLSPVTDVSASLARSGAEAGWQTDPPKVAAERPATESPDPGFDQPTTPSQMSMAAMLAQQAEAARDADAERGKSAAELLAELSRLSGDEVVRRSGTEITDDLEERVDSDLLDALAEESEAEAPSGRPTAIATVDVERDSRADFNDSGIMPQLSQLNRARLQVSRPPTATTSASLAALAALSKPALITMSPTAAARKMPPSKPTDEPAIAAAVAVAVAPGAPVAAPVASSAVVAEEDSAAGAGSRPACPHCDAPMSWADKQLRYYCSTCRVYF